VLQKSKYLLLNNPKPFCERKGKETLCLHKACDPNFVDRCKHFTLQNWKYSGFRLKHIYAQHLGAINLHSMSGFASLVLSLRYGLRALTARNIFLGNRRPSSGASDTLLL